MDATDNKKEMKRLKSIEKKAKKLEKRRLKAIEKENKRKYDIQAHLDRELNYAKLSMKELDEHVAQECEDFAYEKVRNELKQERQSFYHHYDAREHIIKELKIGRELADEQYRRNVTKHTDYLQYIIKLYHLFLKSIRNGYDGTVYTMLSDFYREIRNRDRVHDRNNYFYECLLHATNLTSSHDMKTMKTDFLMGTHELNSNYMNNGYVIRDRNTSRMYNLYQQMVFLVQRMKNAHGFMAKVQMVSTLSVKVCNFDAMVPRILEKSAKCKEIIQKLQKGLNNIEFNSYLEIAKLRVMVKRLKVSFERKQRQFFSDTRKDKNQLKRLANCSHDATKFLQSVLKTGSQIQTIAGVCHKQKREDEEIQSCPPKTLADLRDYCAKCQLCETDKMTKMRLFMRKVALTHYENKELELVKKNLVEENKRLRKELRCYFSYFRKTTPSKSILYKDGDIVADAIDEALCISPIEVCQETCYECDFY